MKKYPKCPALVLCIVDIPPWPVLLMRLRMKVCTCRSRASSFFAPRESRMWLFVLIPQVCMCVRTCV